jgi:alkanesulfonate monooxygenase SsuD/methylene tetrahydromethanopterin reductase-like flavin-dependent oxidoreductase (luciferase family)
MQFDLFHEISVPPQPVRSEAQAYSDTLAEIELADRLGYHCAWLVEHHFMRGYSHVSKPELLLAALSQRTRRIRLGHAVIPLPLHHPVHIAERIATLDVLTGGRLEIGIGRGFSPREYAVFGAGMAQSRELVDESLAILRASFRREPVTHHGKHYRLEALDIVPHVVQQPHPPLWSAAVSPETFPWAAERALGVLAGPFKPWFMVRHDIGRYREAWRGSGAPRVGMTVGVLCLEDSKRAHDLAQPAFTWFYRELYKTTLPVLEKLYPGYEQLHELGRFRQLIKLGIDFGLADAAGLTVVGDPRECIAKLRKYADAGITNLLCAFGAGAVESNVARESLELFAREVMPAFEKQDSGTRIA